MIQRIFLLIALPLFGWGQSYKIENVTLPAHVAPEIGGLGFDEAGQLFVVTRRSGIVYGKPGDDAGAIEWKTFTDVSLHNPMGIYFMGTGDVLVPTMQALTRITDTDGDGVADTFENLNDGWGISGNYHETNGGPVPDGKGGFFIAVGTASHNGPTFHRVRGEYSKIGRRGRNFSAVAYKGWVLRCGLDGSVEPFASGFRANNGIGMSPGGKLFVTDNQGDWRGTSPIYHVEKGDFCGHPSSLVWDETFYPAKGDPLNYGIDNLDKMRKRAAILLPQGDVCNSPGEPIWDRSKTSAFGPFAGQFFIGDIAGARILRCMTEEVNGVTQGAVVKFADGKGLRGGNNRFIFSPGGRDLYTGQTYRGWGRPSEGLQRLRYTGDTPFEILDMKLTKEGFAFRFTKPVDPETLNKSFDLKHYHFDYGHKYGSPKRDTKAVEPTSVKLVDGSVMVALPEIMEKKVYEVRIGVRAVDGSKLGFDRIYYTLNRKH